MRAARGFGSRWPTIRWINSVLPAAEQGPHSTDVFPTRKKIRPALPLEERRRFRRRSTNPLVATQADCRGKTTPGNHGTIRQEAWEESEVAQENWVNGTARHDIVQDDKCKD